MLLDDFDYPLPPGLIAQEPLAERDASRLMTLDGLTGEVGHRAMGDLPALLRPGDLLVVNDTRVLACRLRGRRASPGTGGRVEALLLEKQPGRGSEGGELWTAMARGAGGPGDLLDLGPGLRARVAGRDGELHLLELLAAGGAAGVAEAVERAGSMPLPPYIRREPGDRRDPVDRERYQSIFAAVPGAVAAPTASLHFTPRLVERLRGRGVLLESLTLHVGPGTFQSLRSQHIEDHRLRPEWCKVPQRLAAAVREARARGGRVVAVGTTVTRTLEGRAAPGRTVRAGEGACDLFILPGHRFQVVDALLTNFHLPRSTLLMLVCAFSGTGRVLQAYREAVRRGYRFYSYGDAMLASPGAERAA
ncbi:MAG TPA: tRNA preQ1(34) S-adenosylmethionine ribosyltransferase-isomerase QueA [Candidatus Polarisedimenticolia bacterium]|nr:tRNA preQ1(34) S-adenosylmethionine ribosyltransferase-isomerase QueA [Candidatus Polarisedimenticolia bacterium]